MNEYALSVLIPARNEAFLNHTIQDILANRRAKTEIIAVLDGAWPVEPIPDHPDVTLIYHPESIGQRAACNEAARVSTAKYICKMDAHVSVDEGFDMKLLVDMQDDWTMVPIMRNLHVFDFVCKQCGWRRYQGQTPANCPDCKATELEKEIVWRAKPSPQSKSYCFDSTPHFNYFNEYSKRPEGQGDLTETMSLQGSFFMMTRDKYFELGINDETFGSWGSQGIEVACKTWLSGGRVIVSHKTWYAHMFRSSGGDWSFPYSLPRSQQEHAQAAVRDLFFNNRWEQQIHPLSWLVEKFWPVKGWGDEDLEVIRAASAVFLSTQPSANPTDSFSPVIPEIGKEMPVNAMGFPSVDRTRRIPNSDMIFIGEKLKMVGVTAPSISADVMNNQIATSVRNTPSLDGINQPVDTIGNVIQPDYSVTRSERPIPAPTLGIRVNDNFGVEPSNLIVGKLGKRAIISDSHDSASCADLGLGSERSSHRSDSFIIPQRGVIFYTDNRINPAIFSTVQRQITHSINGHELISVSLQPLDFGRNLVLEKQRGYLTLFEQILAGLEASTAEIIYLTEHDVIYAPEHFQFIPPDPCKIYYNRNVWQVRTSDGFAVYYEAKRLSQLVAYRDVLLEHYRRRVAVVREKGFSRKIGFEPGSHHRAERIDDLQSEYFVSSVPNLDLKHGQNLTPARWSPEQFRDKRNCKGWLESDGTIPGWGSARSLVNRITGVINYE